MAVPYTFATATTNIPLSQLDSNFATTITLGNTAIQLGNTVTTLNNMTFANVTISSVATPITVAQGGTGLVTITSNGVMIGNATGSITTISPGTNGNVLTSNGTTWTSAAPSGGTPGGSSGQVQFNNAGAFGGSANFFWDNTNALLGIGTSTPSAKLTVSQNPNTATGISLTGASSNTSINTDYASLALQNTNTTNNNYNTIGFINDQADFSAGIHGIYTDHTANAQSGAIAFATRNSGTYAERARITSSGNVGIGTSSPLSLLDVAGTASGVFQRIRSTASGSTNVALRIQDNTTGTSDSDGIYLGRVNSTNYLWTYENEPWVFATNNTERARIASDGTMYLNTTSTSGFVTDGGKFYIRNSGECMALYNDTGSGWLMRCNATNNSGTFYFISFAAAGTGVGSITSSSTTTTYATSSDYRLKNVTGPITNSGAYIDALKPVEGTWKADGSTFVGLIAHEAQEVSRTTVAIGAKDGEEMQGMDYGNPEFIANIIAELQSLRQRVAALEAK